jgi:hypothetical protein
MPGAFLLHAGNNERAVPVLASARVHGGSLSVASSSRRGSSTSGPGDDMTESEVEQESKALRTFQKSLHRPVLRWPWRTKETQTHKRWRILASVVRRFRLYADAGLPIEPGMTKALFDSEDAERITHRKMNEEKHCREMHYMTGKTKTPPPWDF